MRCLWNSQKSRIKNSLFTAPSSNLLGAKPVARKASLAATLRKIHLSRNILCFMGNVNIVSVSCYSTCDIFRCFSTSIQRRHQHLEHQKAIDIHQHRQFEIRDGIWGQRITWIGLGSNFFLSVGKGIAGVVGNSSAMIADSLHSFGDLISDFVTLWSHKLARKPKDANYPFGYGKYEPLGALVVSLLLIGSGLGLAWHVAEVLIGSYGHIASHSGPTQIAFWAAVVSIIVNEIIFRVTLFIARTERSKVLEANAWHHRSDALSSLAALAGISGSMIGYPFADPLAGLVVSAMIVHAGWTVLREVVYELTDKQTDTAVRSQVIALLNELKNDQKNQIKGFHSLRLRKMGPYIVADLYITVDPNLKVSEGSKCILYCSIRRLRMQFEI